MKSNLLYFARIGALLALLVGVLAMTGCANFRAAGTFEYAGDNYRAECPAEPEK